MITISTANTDLANMETAVSMGCTDHDNMDRTVVSPIPYDQLSDPQKTVYDDFFNMVGSDMFIVVENFDCVMNIDRITHLSVNMNTTTLDYNSMSDSDKSKIDAFKELANEMENFSPQ